MATMPAIAPVQTINLTLSVSAPVDQVYLAFSNEDKIAYWFADDAKMTTRVGGPIFLEWIGGYYVFGTFVELKENERVAFNWRGAGESQDTLVEINMKAVEGATEIALTLTGVHPEAIETVRNEWNTRLENLKSVLETGEDLRITRRVLLGVYPGNLTEEQAAKLGVPNAKGTLINGVIDGLSAQTAGIQQNDVIVEVEGHEITPDFPIGAVTGKHKPGDVLKVVYYRGSERREVALELKGLPQPAVVADFKEMKRRYEEVNTRQCDEIAALYEGLSEEVVAKRPAENEWSVNEVVAHLILHARFQAHFLGTFLQGPERYGYTCNAPARIAGVTKTYPTSKELLAELRRCLTESEVIVDSLPENFSERKPNLWWFNQELQSTEFHTNIHIRQIKDTLKAVQS